MSNLTEIAIEQGAERIEAHDEFTQSGIFFQDAQLRATIEQICAPLVSALTQINSDSSDDSPPFVSMGTNSITRDIAYKGLVDFRKTIGDKE